ncbi:MAG TPA: DNA-3-methyladenine glycosylase 2 [Gemmatimonadaceae bacterium]|nr:DNA-3-methyladenine glycosylase 2 [Gemmatimonadaceae bacterium]
MIADDSALYSAYAARDPRFDGVFYIGVTSTGIYCRPVCTARTPRASNCRFFTSAEAAEKAEFRPCLRCRPELAPGNAPVDDARRLATLLVQRIDEGMLDDGARLDVVARKFGWSSRQIRRIVQKELGVSPIELVLTRRLLLAKQLLTETSMPVSQVAYSSGFSSLRRFNDAFSERYRMPPTRFRKGVESSQPEGRADVLELQLSYRPPFAWTQLLAFLGARATAGVELVAADHYARTVRLGEHVGWMRVNNRKDKRSLTLELSQSLAPVLPALLGRVRQLFDLNARPDVIASQLQSHPALRHSVKRTPGLRVPGAFDGFELAVRAVLGQQITVKAATSIAGRFAKAFGTPIDTPYSDLATIFPRAERIADASLDEIASLGIIRARATAIIALARAMSDGTLALEPGSDPDNTIVQLQTLPGIGPWTANYIAMRALRWPDAFPKEDVVIRKRLGGVSAGRAEELSHEWKPWRSYATLHLWHIDQKTEATRRRSVS